MVKKKHSSFPCGPCPAPFPDGCLPCPKPNLSVLWIAHQHPQFVGLRNFQRLLSDQSNHDIMALLIFILASVVLYFFWVWAWPACSTPGSLAQPCTINLILAIPTIVAGLAFRWMLDDQYGLVTDWLFRLTGNKYELLVHPATARLCVILVNVWKNTPFMAVVLLAGLQSVPAELYEAARIDGATAFQNFRHITLPISMSLLLTLGLFSFIWQLANFDLSWV